MLLPDERSWRYINPLVWTGVAVLAHATLLAAVFYWPTQPPPSAAPLEVSLIEGTNPYAAPGEQPGGPVAGDLAEEPAPRGPEPAPAMPAPEPPENAPAYDRSAPSDASSPAEEHPPPEPPRAADVVRSPAPAPESLPGLTPQIALTVPRPDSGRATGQPGQADSGSPAGQADFAAALVVRAGGGRALYGNRFGRDKAAAIGRFGGTPGATAAVADALAWLAAHQEKDGHWDRVGFERNCPADDRCGNAAIVRTDRTADAGITALCLLAFLGDGHLPDNALDLYRDTVRRAIAWLLAQQQQDGAFGVNDGPLRFRDGELEAKEPLLMYNHAVATLALAEAYTLTRDARLAEPLRRAVRFLADTQQPEGGWDYFPATTNRNDTSITGWVVMALKAARSAGVEVPIDTVFRSTWHFSRATDSLGRTWYAERGNGVTFNKDTGLPVFRYGPAMVAVTAFSRQLLGYRTSSPALLVSLNRIAGEPPNQALFCRGDKNCLHNEYYWYYGTMAMFQAGGRYWAAWNPLMQRVLVGSQDRAVGRDGRKSHRFGSWAAYGADWGRNWGATGGRIYSTAINTLTLEVFFRYLPLNETPADYDYWPIVARFLNGPNLADRQQIIAWLGQLRPQLAEPLLYRLLGSDNPQFRFAAAVQLASYGSPLARPVLEQGMNWASPSERIAGDYALGQIRDAAIPDVFGPLVEIDRDRGLASFRIGDGYVGYGLPVAAVDDAGAAVARMTVASFDRTEKLAVARLDPADQARWPALAIGQTVKLAPFFAARRD